jgi:hypothetical protein
MNPMDPEPLPVPPWPTREELDALFAWPSPEELAALCQWPTPEELAAACFTSDELAARLREAE